MITEDKEVETGQFEDGRLSICTKELDMQLTRQSRNIIQLDITTF